MDFTGLWNRGPNLFSDVYVLTQTSFLQKNQMLQNGFLISVSLKRHIGVKNHEIWTLKVNFLCQKTSESFYFFSLKNINLEPHFL